MGSSHKLKICIGLCLWLGIRGIIFHQYGIKIIPRFVSVFLQVRKSKGTKSGRLRLLKK